MSRRLTDQGIRRMLQRSGLPIHEQRRLARHLKSQSVPKEDWRFKGDPQAARASQQGAEMGAAFALGMLDAGRWISAGIERLSAHVNGRRP